MTAQKYEYRIIQTFAEEVPVKPPPEGLDYDAKRKDSQARRHKRIVKIADTHESKINLMAKSGWEAVNYNHDFGHYHWTTLLKREYKT